MTKVAVVTGANQGLGLALVEALCRKCGPNAAVYLTARNRERGEAAVAHIRELGLNPIFYRVDVTDESFSIALIPHTLQHTTLGELCPRDSVNLETDLLAKYVERQLRADQREA